MVSERKRVNIRFISATKVSSDEIDSSSDILGISGVIIHDLKQKRLKDYEFNWDLITDASFLITSTLFLISCYLNIYLY